MPSCAGPLFAGCLGQWLKVTNGILQGCPLSVIFINILTTEWKEEIYTLSGALSMAVRNPNTHAAAEDANTQLGGVGT